MLDEKAIESVCALLGLEYQRNWRTLSGKCFDNEIHGEFTALIVSNNGLAFAVCTPCAKAHVNLGNRVWSRVC